MSDQEVPENDAVEQSLPVEEAVAAAPPSTDPEAPEADALEQAQVEGLDEEQAPR
jgi:hypothetical protein